MLPEILFNVQLAFLFNVTNDTNSNIPVAIDIYPLFIIFFLDIFIEHNIAVNPSISNVFEIFDPRMFPNTISGLFFIVAMMFTINSGADVPNATKLSPMMRSGI